MHFVSFADRRVASWAFSFSADEEPGSGTVCGLCWLQNGADEDGVCATNKYCNILFTPCRLRTLRLVIESQGHHIVRTVRKEGNQCGDHPMVQFFSYKILLSL
jgi:hypothetical protein